MRLLTSRQQSILQRVIDTYIETALPVGSKAVTESYRGWCHDSYSPATVRFEMGVLERGGYLTHPHTSAGRIPTDLGYRYYVDHCVSAEPLRWGGASLPDLRREPWVGVADRETLAEDVCRQLSALCRETVVLLVPAVKEVTPPYHQRPEDLRFYLAGSSHLLEKPEFQDIAKLHPLLEMLEEKTRLRHCLFHTSLYQGLTVTIGRENKVEALQECAVITAPYRIHDLAFGILALIGPRRMRYGKMLALVDYFAQQLTSLFNFATEA